MATAMSTISDMFGEYASRGVGNADRSGADSVPPPAGLARPASPLAAGRAPSATPEMDRAKRALAKQDRSLSNSQSTSSARRDRMARSPDTADHAYGSSTADDDLGEGSPEETTMVATGEDGLDASGRPAVRALVDQLDGVRRAWRDEGTSLRSRLMEMHRTRVAVEQQLAEAQARIARLEAEAREREAGLQRDLRAERERLTDERSGWDRQSKEWQEELSTFSKQLAELRDRLAESNRGRRDAEAELAQVRTALATKTDEAAAQSSTLSALTERLEVVRKQAETAREETSAELEEVQRERSEERSSLTRRLEEVRVESQELETRLRRETMRAEQANQDLESQRTQTGTSLASLQARLSEVEADRRRAISEAHRLRELLRVAESEFDLVASAVDELSAGKRAPDGSSPTRATPGYGSTGTSPVLGGADIASLSASGAGHGAGSRFTPVYQHGSPPAGAGTPASASALGSASRTRQFHA